MQHRSAMDPQTPKQFVDHICKQFTRAIERRDRANRFKAKKLARIDPCLQVNRNYLKQFEQVRTIAFNLSQVLSFKKDYRMITRTASVGALVQRCADRFAERDRNVGQALSTLNELKNGRGVGAISADDLKSQIEQHRKRFVQDAHQSVSTFLKVQKRSKMLLLDAADENRLSKTMTLMQS